MTNREQNPWNRQELEGDEPPLDMPSPPPEQTFYMDARITDAPRNL